MTARPSPFAWQGTPSIFVNDARFTWSANAARNAAKLDNIDSSNATSSINTETADKATKSRAGQKGGVRT